MPMLVFGLFGGVVADRFPKRRVLQITQGVIGLASLINAVLVLTGVIQALLEPSLLYIEVAPTAATSGSLQAARAQNVAQYLNQTHLWAPIRVSVSMQGTPPGPVSAAARGLTITVNAISS
jgi:hypothetical protein